MREADPRIRLVAVGRTAPWGKLKPGREPRNVFDTNVARGLGDMVDGVAFHAYYDGISIPRVLEHMSGLRSSYRSVLGAATPPSFVTEHARWSSRPAVGQWSDTWHVTGNLSGALSSADFILSIAALPWVSAANWHSLGALSPWQLIHVHPESGTLFPNVVYWALRVLRHGFLDEVVAAAVESAGESGYKGGYDVRALATRSNRHPKVSVVSVNRASVPKRVRVRLDDWKGRRLEASQYLVTAGSPQADNTVSNPDHVVMQHREAYPLEVIGPGEVAVWLPGNSISAVIIEWE